ncbi:MAG: 50S ribosomal protein L9 [Patescibacteria group bacterium]|jgi:large subunit ribosomal protein L9
MKVVLTEHVQNIGRQGSVINVREGFARNFLFPRKLAVPATASMVKSILDTAGKKKKEENDEIQKFEALIKRLKQTPVVIRAKASEAGRLFGGIAVKDIVERIEEVSGMRIPGDNVQLPSPIRAIGAFEVEIKLAPGHTEKLTLHIEPIPA